MNKRKHILPLTYAPKIPGVISGKYTQTIRAGRKFQVGDLIAFHGWEGKPYRSGWTYLMTYQSVIEVIPCTIYRDGLKKGANPPCNRPENKETIGHWAAWDCLAEKDGIEPPTGEELGRVLLSLHKIPPEGLPAQIIRWRFE